MLRSVRLFALTVLSVLLVSSCKHGRTKTSPTAAEDVTVTQIQSEDINQTDSVETLPVDTVSLHEPEVPEPTDEELAAERIRRAEEKARLAEERAEKRRQQQEAAALAKAEKAARRAEREAKAAAEKEQREALAAENAYREAQAAEKAAAEKTAAEKSKESSERTRRDQETPKTIAERREQARREAEERRRAAIEARKQAQNAVRAEREKNEASANAADGEERTPVYMHTGSQPYSSVWGKNQNTGSSDIEVVAPRNKDVIVIIRASKTNQVVRHGYISRGDTYTFTLPAGYYQTFFYYGTYWNPNKEVKEGLKGGFRYGETYDKDKMRRLPEGIVRTYDLSSSADGVETIPSSADEMF